MEAVQQSNNGSAIQTVKKRFVRLPSNFSSPRFRDLKSGIEQSDAGIIVKFYRKNGGTEHGAEYLLDCLDFMNGEKFKPGAGAIIDGEYLNLWQPSSIKPTGKVITPDQVEPFTEFMHRLFPDSSDRSYFMWWMAHIVRCPDKRITATPLLRTEHGVGKGFLAETLLAGVIGKTSVALCDLGEIVGTHNEILEGKLMLMIDEVATATLRALNKLKSYQGNSTFTLNRKHKPAVTIDNYVNFIMTSNVEAPFTIETGDRRYWVPEFIRHKESQEETDTFINGRFKPWLLDGGFQLVRDYLEFVSLANHQPTAPAPMTSSKKELMGIEEVSLTDVVVPIVMESKVVTVEKIKAIAHHRNLSVTDTAVSNELKRLRCVRKNSSQQRYYITPRGMKDGLGTHTPPKELEHLLRS